MESSDHSGSQYSCGTTCLSYFLLSEKRRLIKEHDPVYNKGNIKRKNPEVGIVSNGSFGKKKMGVAKKSYNKHSPRPKAYKGQGR